MKKKRPASSYLLMLLSAIAVILILLIIYFTVRQQNVSTSTQTEIQTASAREEDGFTSGDAEADDGFTSGDIADASDSPEGFSERESAGPMPVTQAPEQADASQDPSADQPEPAPDDSSQPSEAHANTPEANAEDGAISPSQGNSVFDNKADQTMEDLLAQIRLALPVSNGSWSVYICDLSGGSEGIINDFSMQAASLIKLYIMGAVYENYDSLTQQYGAQTIDGYLLPMITVSDTRLLAATMTLPTAWCPALAAVTAVQVWRKSTASVQNMDITAPPWAGFFLPATSSGITTLPLTTAENS